METYTLKFGCGFWSTRHRSRPFFQHKDQVYVWYMYDYVWLCMYMSLQVHTKSQILDAQRSQATSNLPAPRCDPSPQRCLHRRCSWKRGQRPAARKTPRNSCEKCLDLASWAWDGLGLWDFGWKCFFARMASLQCTHSVIDFWKMLANSGVSKEITLSLQVSSHITILHVTWLTMFVFGW